MPRMGDSVTEGTVLEWHRSEGEHVSAGETLVEISTDKVDAEVAAPASGTLVRIVSAEGESVGVGAVLAEIATRERRVTGVEEESTRREAAEAAAPAAAIVDIVTPAAGESVSEGTILDWTVAVGDHVGAGDTVVEISTDKVDVELPAPASGTITELLAAAGDVVSVGQVIGRMSSGGGAPGTDGSRRAPARSAVAQRRDRRGGDHDGQGIAGRAPRGRGAVGRPRCARRQRPVGTDRQGRRPRRRRASRRRAHGRGHAIARRRRDARALHGGEPRRPDGDELPDDHGGGARRTPASAEGRRREGVIHPPDRVRDRARRRRASGDGGPLRRGRRQAVANPRRRRQPRARGRRREEGRFAHADGPGDSRRRPRAVRPVPRRLRRARREGADEHAHRR